MSRQLAKRITAKDLTFSDEAKTKFMRAVYKGQVKWMRRKGRKYYTGVTEGELAVVEGNFKMLGRHFAFESIEHPVADYWSVALSSFQGFSDGSATRAGLEPSAVAAAAHRNRSAGTRLRGDA